MFGALEPEIWVKWCENDYSSAKFLLHHSTRKVVAISVVAAKCLKLARYLGNDEVCRNFRFFCAFLGEPNVFPVKQYMERCIKKLQLVNMSHCSSISIYIIFGMRAKYNPKILHFF